MTHYFKLVLLLVAPFILMSCAVYHKANSNVDLVKENWPRTIATHPDAWTRGADRWFMTGEANAAEISNESAPANAAISTMTVSVPDFHRITVAGHFQVQIYGTEGHNSVYVYGPNVGVRQVSVFVTGDTLNVQEVKDAAGVERVIVRIGINNLQGLKQMGPGIIEARQVVTDGLRLAVYGSGNLYLAGHIKLNSVNHAGCGKVSVLGVRSSQLDVFATNEGTLNLSGDVGLRSITHHGTGNINIIGAKSLGLVINTDGSGKIGLNGRVNITSITAKGNTCVYAYCINSESLNVILFDNSRVGLAGTTHSLFVDAAGAALFEGRSLHAGEGYARGHEQAHLNVSARTKMFASATGGSSIYYYGPQEVLEQFTEGDGTIFTIWPDHAPNDYLCQQIPYCDTGYKDEVVQHQAWQPRYRWKDKQLITE